MIAETSQNEPGYATVLLGDISEAHLAIDELRANDLQLPHLRAGWSAFQKLSKVLEAFTHLDGLDDTEQERFLHTRRSLQQVVKLGLNQDSPEITPLASIAIATNNPEEHVDLAEFGDKRWGDVAQLLMEWEELELEEVLRPTTTSLNGQPEASSEAQA